MINKTQPDSASRRRMVALAVAGVGAGYLPNFNANAQTNAGKLIYGIGNLDPMFSAGFVALKKGYFKEAGLDASFVDCQNGPRARQMLAAQQVNIVASASFDPMVITIAGKLTKVIAGIDQRLPYANVIVRKEDFDSGRIKSFADLAGKRIGVSAPKSAFWLMATQMVETAGLKGVEIRGIGDLASMLAALKSKQVDASMARKRGGAFGSCRSTTLKSGKKRLDLEVTCKGNGFLHWMSSFRADPRRSRRLSTAGPKATTSSWPASPKTLPN